MKRFLTIVLTFLLTLLAGGLSAATVVRVAWFPEPGLCERRPDGTDGGLVPAYVGECARLNDWEVKYVLCWYGEALEKLKRGEVDLVGGIVATAARGKEFRFAACPAGTLGFHLFVRPDSPCDPDRVATWKDLKIAVGPEPETRRMLEDFLKERGVRYRLQPFVSTADALVAFGRASVSAVFALGTPELLSAKVLKSFDPVPCHFCTAKSSDGIETGLDDALRRLMSEKPDFAGQLSERLFPVKPRPDDGFTDAERNWIKRRVKSGVPIVVDLSPESDPLLLPTRAPGKRTGFACFLLDEVAHRTGLAFAYLLPTPKEGLRDRFLGGKADILVPYGAREADLHDLRAGIRVDEFRPVLVCRKGSPPDRLDTVRLGVPSRSAERQSGLLRAGIRQLLRFDTPDAALNALREKRVDAVPMTVSLAQLECQWLQAEDTFELHAPPVRIPYDSVFTLLPSRGADPCLVSVLRKSIASIARNEIVSSHAFSLEKKAAVPLLTDRQWLTLIFSVLFAALVTVATSFMVYNRRLSKALILAKAGERSRTRFLATMSHEIRTPLNAVIGFAEFLRVPDLDRNSVAGYADGINKASHVLLDLINDVLDLAKLDSDKVDIRQGSLDLRRLAADLAEIFSARAERSGVQLKFVLPKDPVGLCLSPLHIRQVMLNLIGNSVKFTVDGSIVVTFETIVCAPSAVDVRIAVSDTGIGISPEQLPKIFDPFVQDIAARGGRIYEGTGLGLPLVKRIVEAAGGTVDVSSAPGKGATFVLRIPNVRCVPIENPVPVVAEAPEAPKAVRLPKSVVIVDDVEMNLRILALHLNRLGVTDVRMTTSGAEALALLSERPAEAVLTDMWMPGMDGSELARRILSEGGPVTPLVVAVTADVSSSESFDLTPFAAVITKPVTREKLVSVFARFF